MIRGIGTGVVDVDDLRNRAKADAGLLEKIFRPSETDLCMKRLDPWPGLAARLAAKNAVLEALGPDLSTGLALKDIVIERLESGAPVAGFTEAAREDARKATGRLKVSISHAGTTAVAVAVLDGDDRHSAKASITRRRDVRLHTDDTL